MKHEDAIELMKVLDGMGFTDLFIINTLLNCEQGMGVGHAMVNADDYLRKQEPSDE